MKIRISAQGQEVILTGNFDDWKKTCRMMKDESGAFFADITVHEWPLIFKFIVDGQWMALTEYPTSTDDQGNVNNIVQGNDRLSLEMKQISSMPVIVEETSPEVMNFHLSEVSMKDETGIEEVFTISQQSTLQRAGRVPILTLTDADGNQSLLPIVPNILITDSDGKTQEIDDLYLIPKAPAIHSFSDSSRNSSDLSELEKEPIKTAGKHKNLSKVSFIGSTSEETLHAPEVEKEPVKSKRLKKPFKGLKKRASRFMNSIQKMFSSSSA